MGRGGGRKRRRKRGGLGRRSGGGGSGKSLRVGFETKTVLLVRIVQSH